MSQDSFIPNLEFLKNVGFGKSIETIDDNPVETIPGVKGPEFSEDTGYPAVETDASFLNSSVSAPDSSAEDLPDTPETKSDILSVGGRSAQAIVDVPASDFNAATIPLPPSISGAIKLVDSNDERLAITIYNPPATATLFIGSNAAVGNGFSSFPIVPGNSLTMAVRAEIWVISDDPVNASECAYIEYVM